LATVFLIDSVALRQRSQARLTMLYRSTHRLCRWGAPMKNLAHSASFKSLDKNAPSKAGTKHIGLKPEWFTLSTLFDVFNSHRPPRETLSQRSLHELVEIPIKHVGGGTRDVPGAKVFHHLIGLEHIRAYLVAPPNVGL
jgi:hypothetical protein